MTRSVTAMFWLVFFSTISISFGCPASKESACSSNPCRNNGKCMEDEVKYTCKCQKGWTGRTCSEDVNDCLINPCQNDGKCKDIGLNAFNCTCQIGWEGLTCTKDVDDCLRNPCENDGECSDFGTNSFNCECKDGWSGKTCTLQTKSGNHLI